jgi:N-acetylglucosamine-6-phosphate deacetylase
MATATPARAVGLRGVGELAPGRPADLVVLDERLDVTGVMRQGRWRVEP